MVTSGSVYTYDPADPTPMVYGPVTTPTKSRDLSAYDTRSDVAAFTGLPLADDLEVIGPASAKLYVRTDSDHVDFYVALVGLWACWSMIIDVAEPAHDSGHAIGPAVAEPGRAQRILGRQSETGEYPLPPSGLASSANRPVDADGGGSSGAVHKFLPGRSCVPPHVIGDLPAPLPYTAPSNPGLRQPVWSATPVSPVRNVHAGLGCFFFVRVYWLVRAFNHLPG